MEELERGDKVLIFEDNLAEENMEYENIVYGEYSLGTVVDYYETTDLYHNRERYYTVRKDEDDNNVYMSCHYGEEIITPEDYRKCLLQYLKDNNCEIEYLYKRNMDILEQLDELGERLSIDSRKEKALKIIKTLLMKKDIDNE